MNIDDPRLTAYALKECDHLGEDDRAEIEKALAEDSKLAAEVDELRRFTANLRTELHAEKGEGLTAAQRAEVLTSSAALSKVVVPRGRRWWSSEIVGLSVAACAVIGLSATVYYQAEHVRHLEVERDRLLAQKSASENLTVGVPLQLELSEKELGVPPPDASSAQLADLTAAAPVGQVRELAAADSLSSTANNTWAAQLGAIRTAGRNDGTNEFSFGESSLSVPRPAEPASATTPATPFGSQPMPTGATSVDFYTKTPYYRERGTNPAKPGQAPSVSDAAAGVPATIAGRIGSTTPALTSAKSSGVSKEVDKAISQHADARGYKWAEDSIAKSEVAKLDDASGLGYDGAKPQLRRELEEAEKQLQEKTVTLAKEVKTKTGLNALAEGKPENVEFEQLGRRVEQLRARIQEQQDGESNTEAYDSIKDNPFLTVFDNPLSTFSIDVDTASYSNVRRFLNSNQRPPKGAVRIEELVNYFRYEYPQPKEKDPFGATLEVATCPWAPEHRLVRVGIKGREIPRNERPAANLVFLIDVSGSMQPENKLPLVKESLRLLVDQLGPDDSVSIAVYAGASGCVLEPTHDKEKVRTALSTLESGGSTNGAAGIQLAYDLAQRAFKKGGSNRVILCTDGDFNVGTTDQSQLVSMIETKAKTGIFLSVLGFGYGNLKDSTLEKLADKGNGYYGYIDSIAEGRRLFVEQLAGTLCTIAKDVKIQVEFNPAQVGSYRLIGYENRLLAKEDFNDDTKDAGEIGAGHTVTALYEVAPASRVEPGLAAVDELKYQPRKAAAAVAGKALESSSEMLTVKVRYKQPDGDTSTKVEFPLTDSGTTWEKSTRDFRWAAAVAGFGMMLRESPQRGSLSWGLVEELAAEGRAEKGNAERAEFVQLIDKARALSR